MNLDNIENEHYKKLYKKEIEILGKNLTKHLLILKK